MIKKDHDEQKFEKKSQQHELDGYRTILPLSGDGTEIRYRKVQVGYNVIWGKTEFLIKKAIINRLLKEYFRDDEWKKLGASMTSPIPGGMGEYISSLDNQLTPRHASAIAAILVNEGFLINRNKKPILLKKTTNSH